MSDVVPHKRVFQRKGKLKKFYAEPVKIKYSPGFLPSVIFADGNAGSGVCLGCHDAPCMKLKESELDLEGVLDAFPGDPSRDVCPTNAIEWGEEGEVPVISPEDCIGCGLCVARCPYGAISLSKDGLARIALEDPKGITEIAEEIIEPHTFIPRIGTLGGAEGSFISSLPNIIKGLRDTQISRLVRNALVVGGVAATTRRKGDTNIRMDALVRFSSGRVGVIELESSGAALESPRALLEDIAVLHGRFGIPLDEIVPISVITVLPNIRAEYYKVIDDIKTVLGIRCRTLTLGVIFLLIWSFEQLDDLSEEQFCTVDNNVNLYKSLNQLVPHLPDIEPYPGAYRPSK